jgi:hypothetical protein
MFLALDRRDRAGDVAASVLLAVSLASSSIGLPFAAAGIVEVLLRRRRVTALWIPLAPLALWGLWYAAYGRKGALQGTTLGTFGLLRQNLPVVPAYVADMVASGFGALLGLSLEWGRPLALAGLAVLLLRLGRQGPLSARLAGLLALGVTYWGLTAAFRAHLMGGNATRYMYLTAILILLVGAELLRGIRVPSRTVAILGVLVAFGALANFAKLREGSLYLQDTSGYVAAELGALELTGNTAPAAYRPDPVRAPPVVAGPYRKAVADLGSPADSPVEISTRPEPYRQAADTVLLQALRIGPFSRGAIPETGVPPAVAAVEGAAVQRGPCVTFRPKQAPASVEVETVSDVVVHVLGTTAAEYRLRSFADTYPSAPQGTLDGGSTKTLPLGRGELPRPWRLRVTAHARVDICSAA